MSYLKKHIFFNFSFLRHHFLCFSVFSCFGGCASKNTCFMLPLGPWACHCGPTLRPPGPGRANPLHVFPVFLLFSLFRFVRLFSVLPSIPLGPKWHPKATVCSPMAASPPQNANKRYKDDTTNDETTKTTTQRTTKRHNDKTTNDRNTEITKTTKRRTRKQ